MTGPTTTNSKTGGEPPSRAASSSGGGGSSALERLVENLARVFDRLHPPGSPTNGPFAGLSGRLRTVLADADAENQSNEAVLSLKVLLHAIEALRERLEYLDTASGHAYAQLNATEHKSHELRQQIGRLWRMLANLPGMPADTKTSLLDDQANPESRLAMAEQACTALVTHPGDTANETRVSQQTARELATMREHHEQELAAAKEVSEAVEAENRLLKKRLADLEAKQALPDAHEKEVRRLEANLESERHQVLAAANENRDLKHRITQLQETLTTSSERLTRLTSETARLREDGDSARVQADMLSARLVALERERDSVRQQAEKAERDLNGLRNAASTGDQRSGLMAASLAEAETTAATLRRELERTAERAATLAGRIATLEHEARESGQRREELLAELLVLQDERSRNHSQLGELERTLIDRTAERDAAIRERATLTNQLAAGSVIKDSLVELEQTRAALAQQLETVEEERLAAAREHSTAIGAARSATEAAKRAHLLTQEAAAEAQARAEEARDAVADLADSLRTALEALAASAGDDATATEADHAARELGAAAVGLRGAGLDALANRLGTLAATRATAVQALSRVCEHLVSQASEAHGAREQAQQNAARVADLHRRVEQAVARATSAEAELAERTQALAEAEAAQTTNTTLRKELEAESARWRAQAETMRNAAKDEAERLRERLATAERGKTSAELAAKDALSSHASARSEAETAKATLATIGNLLGHALEASGAPELLAKAAATRLEQLDSELARAHSEGVSLRERLQVAANAAANAASDGTNALHQAEASIAKLELRSRAAEERGEGLTRELEQARDIARARTSELAETHQALAAATADLGEAREQLADHQLRIEAALATASEVPGLRTELEASRAEALAARDVTSRLLDAVKELGHAANAAAERVGVGLPSGSRHLTRTTARIARALAGAEFEVAVESARSVCGRAAEQAQALAAQVDNERRTLHALKDNLEATRSERDAALRERDAARTRIAELDGLPGELAKVGAERQKFAEELDHLRDDTARQLAELDSRLRGARAAADEAEARTAALASDLADTSERLRIARGDGERGREALAAQLDEVTAALAAEQAGAREKDAALQSALEERDTQLVKMRSELDKLRMRQTEVMGLEARIRTLDAKLSAANSEVARLRAEREADGDRLNAAEDAEAARARMRAELDEAERAVREAESALAEERARTAELGRQRIRLEREWKRRLAALEEELAEERTSAARSAADLSSMRGELAGLKTRGRR